MICPVTEISCSREACDLAGCILEDWCVQEMAQDLAEARALVDLAIAMALASDLPGIAKELRSRATWLDEEGKAS